MTSSVARFIALFVICISPVLAQNKDISYKSTEVAPGLFMLEGVGGFTGGNLGILTGIDGTILIDDGMQPLVKKMRSAVRKHAGKNIEFVINTHAHGDHIGGNEAMSQSGATIVGHEKLRHRLIDEGITGADGQGPATKHWLPKVTYTDTVSLHLNGQHVRVFHAPSAHTDGDSIVHFPDVDVIHAGDTLFNGLFPFIDLNSGGSVDGYLAAQQRILLLAGDETRIIPGHGPLANKDDVEAANDMLTDSRDRIAKLVNSGKTEDEIVKLNPLADYHNDWNWGFITTEKMTRTLVKDSQGK